MGAQRPERQGSNQLDGHLGQAADALLCPQGCQLQRRQLANDLVLAVRPPGKRERPHGIAWAEQVVRVVWGQMPASALP